MSPAEPGRLVGHARRETPHVFDYQAAADNQSMLNTPPTFAWYMAGLVFKWLKKAGGLAAVGERNRFQSVVRQKHFLVYGFQLRT